MRNNSTQQASTGFTVPELLIVMSILAVLMMVLFPVMRATREAGLAVKCTGNLKQIGTALHTYMADRQGRFPPTRLQHYAHSTTGARTPVAELYHQLKAYLPAPPSKVTDYAQAGAWWCPADRVRPPQMAADSYGIVMAFGGSKAMKATWDGKSNGSYDARYDFLRSAEKPLSELIYMIEFIKIGSGRLSGTVDMDAWPVKQGSSHMGPSPSELNRIDFTRHGGVANALFLDGGVRRLKMDDLLGSENRYLDPKH